MAWDKFIATNRLCDSCLRTDYVFSGDLTELMQAVINAVAVSKLTAGVRLRCDECSQSGTALSFEDVRFVRDTFNEWGDLKDPGDTALKGDIAEIKFLTLRRQVTSGQPVEYRPKNEALSSRTAGWDLLEIHLTSEPWFVLWEIKGTDSHPESQSRRAREQLRERCLPWLAKLSKLLEDELAQSHGQDAARFGARLHEMALKHDDAYHIGIGVVVEDGNLPSPTFEMFSIDDQSGPKERRLGVFVVVPEFTSIRGEVLRWIRDLTLVT